MFRDAVRITPDNDAPLLANALMTHVRRLGTIRARVEGGWWRGKSAIQEVPRSSAMTFPSLGRLPGGTSSTVPRSLVTACSVSKTSCSSA